MTKQEFNEIVDTVKKEMLEEYVADDIHAQYTALIRIGILSTIDTLKARINKELFYEEDDLK